MEQNENKENRFEGSSNPRAWSGVILLIIGGLLLAYKMGAPVPEWIFTWPVLLIAIGLLMGVKSRFHNPGAYIMIIIGSIFLIDQTQPQLNFHNYILPVILISVGLIYILRPRNSSLGNRRSWRERRTWERSMHEGVNYGQFPDSQLKNDAGISESDAEYIEINAVFGGVKKIILSKNFRGGEINCFMGGSEINLIKADIQKPAILEVNNIFGGTKLIVPSNWDVKNEITAVFGGVEDKRSINGGLPDAEKIIVLKGTCVFGGIEIKNF